MVILDFIMKITYTLYVHFLFKGDRCPGLFLPSALEVPLYTCGGVGEVIEGPWVGPGSVPRVEDLAGWNLPGKVQKSWNMCWALSASGTFGGRFRMTAGDSGGKEAVPRLTPSTVCSAQAGLVESASFDQAFIGCGAVVVATERVVH